MFEKNDFISKLDQYVWEQVCALLQVWQKKGYSLPVVSVNVSRVDMYLSDLAETLLAITRKYGIHPAYLHLEITESAYAETPEQIISTVEELRRRVQHLRDIADFRERERTLRDAADRDDLTRLLNRRGFRSAVSSLRTENLPRIPRLSCRRKAFSLLFRGNCSVRSK